MTLILDLTIFSMQSVGGVNVVWGEYLKRIPTYVNEDFPIRVLIPPGRNNVLDDLKLDSYQVEKSIPRRKYTKYLPSFLRGAPQDILHMSYYQWYPMFRGRKVVTVHDFIHEKYGAPLQRVFHGILQRLAINQADAICCISETTRCDLLEYFPNIENTKIIRVIHNAVGEQYYSESTEEGQRNKPYLLWVGRRAGYKNFDAALKCMVALRAERVPVKLVVVGAPLIAEEFRRVEGLGLQECLDVRSNVDTVSLRRLYSNAVALLYLSRYEGFGLPILEAQRCGCPVICLSVPACEEVGRDAALYLDESDIGSVVHNVLLLQQSGDRMAIVNKGLENTKRFSWDKSVEALVDLYRCIAQK